MDSKILLAVIGSAVIGAVLMVSSLVSGNSLSIHITHPGIYRLRVPKFDGVNRDFSNLKITERGKEIPFWVESFDDESAKVWVNLKEPGRISITTTNRMYRGKGLDVFPVFDDFSNGLKLWRVKNDLPQVGKLRRMPRTRECMGVSVKGGHLILENGRPFGKCWMELEKDLLRTVKIRLKVYGRFELSFSDRKSSRLVLENPFDKGGWEVKLLVSGKTVKKEEIKPIDGWFYIKLANGKFYLEDRKLNIGGFSPKRLSLSLGIPGRIEVDYVYSLNSYGEVILEK